MPMTIRNPFKKTAAGLEATDGSRSSLSEKAGANGVHHVDIKGPVEYKLSEINDSGVFLPPSPTVEKGGFWQARSNASTTSSNHRSLLSDTEPFNISRESFDSYRRSFDISGQSPIPEAVEAYPRMSLDSRRARLPRTSLNEPRYSFERAQATVDEEAFEDVGLNDDPKPKKRGIFSRFGDSNSGDSNAAEGRPSSNGHHSFHFTGRKRGQSGQGAELRPMGQQHHSQPAGVPRVVVDS